MKSGRAHNSREKTVAASCEKRIFREMFAHARERNRKVPFLHSTISLLSNVSCLYPILYLELDSFRDVRAREIRNHWLVLKSLIRR